MKTELTNKEMKVLEVLVSAYETSGIQSEAFEPNFGTNSESEIVSAMFIDKNDIPYENRKSLGGILSNLEKKGLIEIEKYIGASKVNYIWADVSYLKSVLGMDEAQKEQEEIREQEEKEANPQSEDETAKWIGMDFQRWNGRYEKHLRDRKVRWTDADQEAYGEANRRWKDLQENRLKDEDRKFAEIQMMIEKMMGL